ncbi:MAG: hypothetical protein HC929_22820 [Leptolyngbyaceae cyanobacterium SM2_5_2]|nr:hypothetical protein [Leptolyngbyaceae cyanobacterium SM2_5_2]
MELFNRQWWLNFLALLPATGLTVLTLLVAFLRFYDEQDFFLLGLITQSRLWSNRLTVAALLVVLVNFGVEWNRRNRETYRLAAEEQRRNEEEQRNLEERERAASRAQIQNRWIVRQIRHLLDPSPQTQAAIADYLQFLQDDGEL